MLLIAGEQIFAATYTPRLYEIQQESEAATRRIRLLENQIITHHSLTYLEYMSEKLKLKPIQDEDIIYLQE